MIAKIGMKYDIKQYWNMFPPNGNLLYHFINIFSIHFEY